MRWWSGDLRDDHASMVEAIDALCDRHVTPEVCDRWDQKGEFPFAAMEALAASSWSGLPVPSEYGGSAASAVDLVVVHQALARRSLALGQAYYSLWVLGADAITRLGSDAQRTEWLPRLAAGDARIAFALTEPGSGSNAAALRTRATRDGDAFVVNGQKVFITGAAVADSIVTAVRTDASGRNQHGISLLMIDPTLPGITIRKLSKIGLRSIDLCEVFFDDVRVDAANVLGDLDEGWRQLHGGLARERLYLSALSLGALCDVIGLSLAQASDREVFGRPIGSHQMTGAKIVEMRVAADATAGLARHAADLVDRDDAGAATAAACAKLFGSRAYVSAAREGVQIFGGYGFTDELPIARHYRDCKYLEIGGGTSEIQTIVIGRSMGLGL